MNISPVAYRYARSLMALALERDQLEPVRADMEVVADTCSASRDLSVLLRSPVVKADKKDKVLDKVFAGKVGTITNAFMGILVRKGRETLLPEIAAGFGELYRKHEGILICHVTSATALDEAGRKRVTDLVAAKHPGKTIELSVSVDPELIGGVVIRIGDEQYDGSVSRRLLDLRRQFSENPYVPEF